MVSFLTSVNGVETMPFYPRNAPRKQAQSALALFFVCTVLLAACARGTEPDRIPSPAISQTPSRSTIDTRRRVTAQDSFQVALDAAMAWRKDAQWYGIIPFTSIERALAIPFEDDKPSWFFRFAVPVEKDELIIEVLDGQVIGSNEMQLPGYIEPLLTEIEPLGNQWTVLDNTVVLEKYLEQPDSLLAEFAAMLVDYRLSYPKGHSHPLWTLYNAQNLTAPIFVLDAVTGQVVE